MFNISLVCCVQEKEKTSNWAGVEIFQGSHLKRNHEMISCSKNEKKQRFDHLYEYRQNDVRYNKPHFHNFLCGDMFVSSLNDRAFSSKR